MNKILSCVKLDIRLVKPYSKSILFLLVLGIFMGFMFKSSETLSSYFMMMIMLVISYPFAIIDKNHLDILYGTLSLSKKSIVIGRYLFVLLLTIVCAILSIVCSLILSSIIKEEIVISQLLLIVCSMFTVLSLVISLQYPIYFKYGYTKAKMIAMIPLFTVFAIIIMVPSIAKLAGWNLSLTNLFDNLTSNAHLLCIGLIFIGLMFLLISYFISYKLYNKKDI